jgi:FecR protein
MGRVKWMAAVSALALSAMLFGQGYPPPPQAYPPQQNYPPQNGYPAPPSPSTASVPDQPGQAVARLSVINGEASVRRGDSGEWVAAVLNAPLMAGDSVSVATGGSAELQLDYANFVRIAGDSEIRISALENGRNQIQMAKGLITYRVLRDTNAQSEISTPAVAVHPLRQAAVRVEVAPDGGTRIIVRKGDVEAATPRGTERMHEGSMMLVRGSADDPEYQVANAAIHDQWDNWNDQRDTFLDRAQSNRYLSQDITGGEDLDASGRWGYDPSYGNVWTPNVAPGWAPYSNGQWVWEDYYGWTWVDYAPWGWAPFHYGSWYFRAGLGWSWFPGQRFGHYWYHPAMVGFFGFGGGVGVGFGFGNVGWVPLAPFEAFRPWYGRSVGGRVGVVANVNVVNTYRNARFAGGVNAVSATDFQRGAFGNRVAVSGAQLQQASLARGALPITPTASNLRFSNRSVAASTPRAGMGNQRFFSRMPSTATAAQRTPFAQQQAAVRSGVNAGNAPAAGAGWRTFGEPAGQRNPGQTSNVPPQRSTPSTAGNWNRFGSPQQTAPQRSAAPAYRSAPAPSSRSSSGGGGGHSSGGHSGGGHR